MDEFASQVIELKDAGEVKRWCEFFGCNEADLIHAVYRVGASARAVHEYLVNDSNRARGIDPSAPKLSED